jgi:hypothetical protein
MTTSPVTTITDELLAEIEAAATESLEGCRVWFDLDSYAVKALDECDVHHVIAASPANVHAIITELRTLRAEKSALSADIKHARTDAIKALTWLLDIRVAAGIPEPGRTLYELVDHVAGLAKDAGRYRLFAETVVAEFNDRQLTPSQLALFTAMNSREEVSDVADLAAMFDAAMEAAQ